MIEITAGLENNSYDIGNCFDPAGACLRRVDIFQCGSSGGTEGGGSPDPDPDPDSDPVPEEVCDDGVDNDGDTLVDEGCAVPSEDDELVIRYTPGSTGGIELWGWSGLTGGGAVFGWSLLASESSASVLEYRATQPAASFVEFNLDLSGITGVDWACERSSHDVFGTLTAAYASLPLAVSTVDNGFSGCNFRIEIP